VNPELPYGLYDTLLDEKIREVLSRHPELRAVFGKLDTEEQPSRYAAFLTRILEQVIGEESDSIRRLALCNRLIEIISRETEGNHLVRRRLIQTQKQVLLEITPPNYGMQGLPRPQTPVTISTLFTGSPQEPQLVHELQEEMRSADSVDILVSFIKWSGLRLLMSAFEDLNIRDVPVRIVTTSYMGASDAPAIEWLARLTNIRVRISYDTERTRLHAKAYHFRRLSGFSTAYIGSANMSQAAITSGLEWNLKVTAQDMGHILEKFTAEFETYWNSREFIPFDPEEPQRLRFAISRARNSQTIMSDVFFDVTPHPFQERILEALERERVTHNRFRNLVIAATGTGKTVVAAFDFRRFFDAQKRQARLLFVAHRQEILHQALATFRTILRNHNFGELLVGSHEADRMEHLFCSVGMLTSRRLWERVGRQFYDYIIVDEVHHGTADSYRPIFDHFTPTVLLGLTATPERMDGDNVAADFGNHFAAEIRLPDALEEKMLCPFHYFGVADPVALDQDRFWRNGKYDSAEMEKVYTGTHILARQRVDAITQALERYEPEYLQSVKGIGFCVTINHAAFMAEMFTQRGIPSAAFVSGVDDARCSALLEDFRAGRLIFLFTVDKLSEGVDVPELNTVLFLRPTESLTIFLQQLGRGLRHSPGKDCLTVLDFVGQAHHRYRIDSKLKALLPKHRYAIDREVELDFPHLPAGCSIQLDRLSRQYVLGNIRENLRNLAVQVPDRLQSFATDTGGLPLTFRNFVTYHDYEPEVLLARETWTGWKAKARVGPLPIDPDLTRLRHALVRTVSISGPREIRTFRRIIEKLIQGDVSGALVIAGESTIFFHYRIWGETGKALGMTSLQESFGRLASNLSILSDLNEILEWAESETTVGGQSVELPFFCPFELHANYGIKEIQAGLHLATLETAGQRGVGVIHFPRIRAYALLITYQKTEREFSPSTMYADYPISRELLHWESQSNTVQNSETGQNLVCHKERGYTILIFARDQKRRNSLTVPFTYLGPAECISFESERPIKMLWRLRHPMPVDMFEENRRGG
jgi:superfamily II DNA or RNA helicase/HKD family nuclease